MLDELEDTAEDAPPRSVDVLVRRSLNWLGPEHQARFELLAIYPPGAAITQPMLEDLWETSPKRAKEIRLLVRAGLAQPVRRDRHTIELHDLITAWLHHERGRPDDARHQPVHQRLAGLAFFPMAAPAAHPGPGGMACLPPGRRRCLGQAASPADPEMAQRIPGRHRFGRGVPGGTGPLRPRRPRPSARARLPRCAGLAFRGPRQTLIGQLPIPLLVAMALVGDPIAAIAQAGQHPRPGRPSQRCWPRSLTGPTPAF